MDKEELRTIISTACGNVDNLERVGIKLNDSERNIVKGIYIHYIMQSIKSYTDINQSKKLAEFLPLESADMYWSFGNIKFMDDDYDSNVVQHIPAWSLAALLGVYPMVVGRDMDMYCCWQNSKNLHSRHYDNPIDACVEMIIKLHELKML